MRLTRTAWISLSIAIISTARITAAPLAGATTAAAPTFSKDIAPVLFNCCAECHRPGAMAPMSLLTYEDARPWAKAINGEPVTDQTQIGVVLAKEPPTRLRAGGGQIPNVMFAIPAGHANYEVVAKQTINRDTYLSTMYPHMHVRGKDVSYTIVYPDGREAVVLNVPQ